MTMLMSITTPTRLAKHLKPFTVVHRCSPKSVVTSRDSLGPVHARAQSTSSTNSHNSEPHASTSWLLRGSSVRISTLLATLLALGAGATALGLYEIYTSFTLWPVELRKDLRAGIRAKNQGDHALGERYLARAYQTALTLPLSVLGSEPYLRLTGIAAVLAEIAPQRRAKEVLRDVWNKGDASSSTSSHSAVDGDSGSSTSYWGTYTLTNEECLRRVSIACKLAELCSDEDGEEEEKWLVWAVEEVLRLAGVQAKIGESDGTASDKASASVVLAELELPSWMRRADLGAPLAALGSVYAQKGNVDYAMPLYLQAVSLLIPPNKRDVSIEDSCEAAQLMNNLSELLMRRPPSPEVRYQSEAWARQAYGLIERVQKTPLPRTGWFGSGTEQRTEVCDQVLGVVLFNLGILREMDEDHATARSLYEESLKQCEKVGGKEGIIQTKQALRRLDHARRNTL